MSLENINSSMITQLIVTSSAIEVHYVAKGPIFKSQGINILQQLVLEQSVILQQSRTLHHLCNTPSPLQQLGSEEFVSLQSPHPNQHVHSPESPVSSSETHSHCKTKHHNSTDYACGCTPHAPLSCPLVVIKPPQYLCMLVFKHFNACIWHIGHTSHKAIIIIGSTSADCTM